LAGKSEKKEKKGKKERKKGKEDFFPRFLFPVFFSGLQVKM